MTTAVCVLYRPEKACPLFDETPDEPYQESTQTPTQTFALNQKLNLRATLRDRAHTHVPHHLPAEEKLRSDIEELCTATLIIDQAFYDISRKLSDATKQQNKRADLYEACHTLESQWNEHHLTYKKLLWRSREFAGDAQTVVDDFREVVLPSLKAHDRPPAEKKEIIRNQLQLLRDMSQPSQNLSQEFLDFGRALDTFIAEFSLVVESLDIGKQSRRVDSLEERLRSARKDLEIISQEVKELGWKFAADVAVAGIAIYLAFVAPTWWECLASTATFALGCTNAKYSGAPFFKASERCDAAVTEYEAILAEYELQKASLSQMAKLDYALRSSRPLVQEVTMRLGIFANVWAAIKGDIQQLRGKLQIADDTTSSLFTQRVEKLEAMYSHVSQALRYYQATVWAPIPGDFMPS